MARAQSPAETLLNTVIAHGVTLPLKNAGFRKAGNNYHRRHGQTVQVVNVQVSHGSTWTEKSIYVNAGVAFDAICELAGLPVQERPKEHECDGCGTRDRLGELVNGAPDLWTLRPGEDVTATTVALRCWVDRLRVELDRIDGLAAYRSHEWFDRFRPKQENAQILYLLGDLDGARQEVERLATLFSDRQKANLAEWWIDELRLTGLKDRGTRRCN